MCKYGKRWEMMVQDIPSLQYVYFWNSVEMEVAASLQFVARQGLFAFLAKARRFHTWQCRIIWLRVGRDDEHQAWRKLVQRVFAGYNGYLAEVEGYIALECELNSWSNMADDYVWNYALLGFTSMHLPLAIQCYTGIQSQHNVWTAWVLYSLWPRIEGWDRRDRHNCWICRMPAFFWVAKQGDGLNWSLHRSRLPSIPDKPRYRMAYN